MSRLTDEQLIEIYEAAAAKGLSNEASFRAVAEAAVQADRQVRPDFKEMWDGYLKDGETPFERFMRERSDLNALMKFYQRAVSRVEELEAVQAEREGQEPVARMEWVSVFKDMYGLHFVLAEEVAAKLPAGESRFYLAPPAAPVIPQCFMTAESGNGGYRLVMKFQSRVDLHKAHDAMIAMLATAKDTTC